MLPALALLAALGCGPLTLDDEDGDGFSASYDCDDGDADVSPGAPERCEGSTDEDCDGAIDEGSPPGARPAWLDYDGDGVGLIAPGDADPPWVLIACAPPPGYSAETGDCDDADPRIRPGAPEACDGQDNDCDGEIDEGMDADLDGALPCGPAPDCDDGDPAAAPGSFELCDGRDNDCDGPIDEGADADGDGFEACPRGDAPGDCDDGDPDVSPGAPEICAPSGAPPRDDDCDGLIDEGLDGDGDGFTRCGAPEIPPDCADGDADISPAAPDVCDGRDNDCDGYADEGFPDQDGDGAPTCIDCDDGDPARGPGRAEACDARDNDCDAHVDEGTACPCEARTYGGHSYLFCTETADWGSARARCQSFGYDLLTLQSPEENTWVADTAGRILTADWWMGLTDAAAEGAFLWLDGAAPTFDRWAPGEPNNLGDEDCGGLYPDGTWNDKACATPWFRFICEAAPLSASPF